MTLTKEAILQIQETAQLAQVATVLDIQGDGRTQYVQIGGDIKEIIVPPTPRHHVVQSLDDLIRYCENAKSETKVIWHGATQVVLVLDDTDRRDVVVFPLMISERFHTLCHLGQNKPFLKQPQFVRLLRIDLDLDNTKVVSQFRGLDWSQAGGATGEVVHGQDRMGKTIMAKVEGVDQLPDELTVELPVYKNCGERDLYRVRCAIEIDTQNTSLGLFPVADEIERITDLAQASIHTRLESLVNEKVAVYYGTP